LRRREWASTAAMTAGLAGLLYFLSPTAARSGHVPWYAWVAGIGINLVFAAAMVAWGAMAAPAGTPRSWSAPTGPRWRLTPIRITCTTVRSVLKL
jgi:Na+/melibiose symporter-like transporter